MPDGNGFPGIRLALEKLADRIVQPNLTLLDEQHDSGGNELLADRRNLVDGFGRRRSLELHVRDAVPRALDDSTFLEHDQREARDVLPLHFVLDKNVCPVGLRAEPGDNESEQREREMSIAHENLACPVGAQDDCLWLWSGNGRK